MVKNSTSLLDMTWVLGIILQEMPKSYAGAIKRVKKRASESTLVLGLEALGTGFSTNVKSKRYQFWL